MAVEETLMHIVHGAWIPDDTDGFVRRGAFYLWVESDTPARLRSRKPGAPHPRQLSGKELAAFLVERLGVEESFPGSLPRLFVQRYFLLPSADGKPLPSYELQPYVEDDLPEQTELLPWQVCCHPVPYPVATLNSIHFLASHDADDFQLGSDFLFWRQFTQVLKGLIARDQYVPAIKRRELEAAAPTRGKCSAAPSGELHYGWEWRSEDYEAAIARYAPAMPAVCAAGSASAERAALYAREPLLRRAAECLLHDAVTGTPRTAKFEQQLAGSLLERCLSPSRAAGVPTEAEWEDYRAWAAWRRRLTVRQTAGGFRLCFRLLEAPAGDSDGWHMQLLVAAKQDPSLQLSLDNYWRMDAKAKATVERGFGADFQQHLLLALGHAARVYPKLWDGLHTDHPAGFALTPEEAFDFLRESAWVLQDAGFAVLVPSWWTPEGRRRAKVRLRTSLRRAATSARRVWSPTSTSSPSAASR